MGGEDIGQDDHRLHQRIDIARPLAAHPFKDFVAAQLFKYLARFMLVHRQQTDRNVFQNPDEVEKGS